MTKDYRILAFLRLYIAAKAMKVEFDETLHPRDEGGKFTEGAGSSGSKKPKKFKVLIPTDKFVSYDDQIAGESIFHEHAITSTQSETDALADYVGGNTALINGRSNGRPYRGMSQAESDKKLTETRKHLDDLIDRSSVPEDIKVFRGISSGSFLEDLAQGRIKKGSIITDSGYTSTSLKHSAIEHFSRYGGIELHVNVPKGSKGLYVNSTIKKSRESGLVISKDAEGSEGERELLLPRKQPIRVKSIKEHPDWTDWNSKPERKDYNQPPRYIVEAELVKPKKGKK